MGGRLRLAVVTRTLALPTRTAGCSPDCAAALMAGEQPNGPPEALQRWEHPGSLKLHRLQRGGIESEVFENCWGDLGRVNGHSNSFAVVFFAVSDGYSVQVGPVDDEHSNVSV